MTIWSDMVVLPIRERRSDRPPEIYSLPGSFVCISPPKQPGSSGHTLRANYVLSFLSPCRFTHTSKPYTGGSHRQAPDIFPARNEVNHMIATPIPTRRIIFTRRLILTGSCVPASPVSGRLRVLRQEPPAPSVLVQLSPVVLSV